MKIEFRPIDAVKPYLGKCRAKDAAISVVAGSIREEGFSKPILLDAEGVVVAGHIRLAAARSLGIAEVPVIVCDELSQEQIDILRLADSAQTAHMSTWQEDLLVWIRLVDWSVLGVPTAELAVH